MSERNATHLLRLIVALFLSLYLSQPAAGQTNKPPDDKETLQALLSEVTMLRRAMQTLQRMSVDTYRSQLLVERVRLQREDVWRLTTALDEIRETIDKTARTIPSFSDRQKVMETYIQQEADPLKRAKAELELKQHKDSIEVYKTQLERFRAREQEMVSQL